MRPGRRAFLATAGGAALGLLGLPTLRAETETPALFVSAAADRDGGYVVAAIDQAGALRFEQPLPARGHGVAFHPSQPHGVVFARRPGTFAAVLDTTHGTVLRWIEAAAGRHFYGHGVFSADGSKLFATENDYAAARGVIGIYDTGAGYARIGELSSHGIGPHDLRLMPDATMLVVANGGIRTHPHQGRAKLNIPTMAPNLAYIDAETGQLRDRHHLPRHLHKLSIRHLDVNRHGRVAVAMQYEGDRRDRVPLVGLHDAGGAIRLLHAPDAIQRRMRHYTGSVAFDARGTVLAATSPRGHVVTLWDAGTGDFLKAVEAIDASGVAPTGRDGIFLVTGGDGAIRLIQAGDAPPEARPAANSRLRWDNHVAGDGGGRMPTG